MTLRPWLLSLVALTVIVAQPDRLFAQRDLKNIPVPDPEEERKTLQVAEGFEINLYAADPLLAKPIQMNFDAQGRLWVASSEIYPQIAPGVKANDKIIVLEDADGDGKAEKTTVFADGLLIPTGIEPGEGGAYVANSTELVHFKDTDGDGKADVRKVVLSGFGTEDTHHILHTLRWGHEGLLYFNQSIYIHSHIETSHGVRRLESGGIWSFRPATMELEVFAKGFVNTWGHHQDTWGQSFATDGAYGEGINYVFPGSTFVTYKYAKRILKGLNPGSPKHCGLEILSGRHLPDNWQGSMVTNDFRAHRVCRFAISEDGTSYTSKEQPELVKSNHVSFRPIDVKMGPDGAIYIADWYNPIIQHGEVDFRDPRRDHTHGRIWRVTAKGRPLVERPKLAGAKTADLLEQLKSPEGWTRHFAKRVLSERKAEEVLPALAVWLKGLKQEDANFEHHRLEALWVYQTFDTVNTELLTALLRSNDHRSRAAATRVVYHWHKRLENPLGLLAAQVVDDHPRVRLEAVRALSQLASPSAVETAMLALDKPTEMNLDFALWQTANDLAPQWMPALESGQLTFGGNSKHLEFALASVASPGAAEPLLRLATSGKLPVDRAHSILMLVAGIGSKAQIRPVFEQAIKEADASPERSVALLAALAKAAKARNTTPEGDLAQVTKLFAAKDESIRSEAIRLAGAWKLQPSREEIAKLAAQADASERLRLAAIAALADLGGAQSLAAFGKLAANDQPPAIRQAALVAWSPLDLPGAAERGVAVLAETDVAKHDPSELIDAFLKQKGGPAALQTALSSGNIKLPPDVAKLGVRLARGAAREQSGLIEAFNKAGGLTGGPKKLSPEETQALLADVASQGNAARGEAIFRRKDLACLKCHAIGGAGGLVGPDMISLGAAAQVDYLLESLLDPNAKIKENYHALIVSTSTGKVLTGIRVRATKEELVIRDAEDREVTIPTGQIDEQVPGKSLMPVGLVDSLTRAELVDLVRFLSELGKVGPYAVSKTPLVRRWKQLEATADAHQALNRTSFATAAGDDPRLTWTPVYSQVGGVLPVADLPALKPHSNLARTGFVRFELNVTTAGKVKLSFGDEGSHARRGLELWVDGRPTEMGRELELDLATGVHTFTLAVNLDERKDGLRVELVDVPGSPARAHVVGGK